MSSMIKYIREWINKHIGITIFMIFALIGAAVVIALLTGLIVIG